MKNLRLITFVLAAAILAVAICAACGSGSGHQATPTSTSLSITPDSVTVARSGNQQFVSSSSGVTWMVDNVAGGNSKVGTISSNGLYTAPSKNGTHTVSAVNPTDPAEAAVASVVVAAAGSVPTSGSGSNSGSSSSGSSTPGAPSNATFSNIDEMGGWDNCGSCAGKNGHGPSVAHSLSQGVSSPSMDGKSAHFWIGGKAPFANALWWKQLDSRPHAQHFIYDLYFYYTNAGAAQALEFDVNQAVDGKKYIFGHQCNIAAHQWDVWDTKGDHWVHTGINCSAPPTHTWNHVVFEFERTGGKTHFIAVTLNGKKSYINRTYSAKSHGGSELNVAFQMDEASNAVDYDVWLDKVNFTAW